MAGPYLTLKDMTGGSGCTPRTVRYYEREGLLCATRSAGGHRLFGAGQLERLNFIIRLREAGWALDEVGALLAARERSTNDQDAARSLDALLGEQIERLERKMAALSQLRVDLSETRTTMQVCLDCISTREPAACDSCDQLPALPKLPSGFRLAWRAKELADARPFEDVDATDDGQEPAEES